MHSYKAFGLNISSEIILPELIEGDGSQPADIRIITGEVENPELSSTQIHRRGIQAESGEDEHGRLYLDWRGVGTFRAARGEELKISVETKDSSVLSLFTVSEALGLLLFQRNYFLLHASAVKVGNEAWCFMGAPGAGKSSTAAAFVKAGCQLLGDDLTAIQFDASGKPFVVPAYPQLKIWNKTVKGLAYDPESLHPVSEGVNKFSYQPKSDFPTEPIALTKVYFLHHAADQPEYRLMGTAEVPGEMLMNFPLAASLLNPEVLKRHFAQSLQCARHAEICRKRRPEGFESLEGWVREMLSRKLTIG